MRHLCALVASLLFITAPLDYSLAYTTNNAKYVAPTGSAKQLTYIVCLESKARSAKGLSIEASMKKAVKSCEKLAPEDAVDIQSSILHCGFRKGDASPDADC